MVAFSDNRLVVVVADGLRLVEEAEKEQAVHCGNDSPPRNNQSRILKGLDCVNTNPNVG